VVGVLHSWNDSSWTGSIQVSLERRYSWKSGSEPMSDLTFIEKTTLEKLLQMGEATFWTSPIGR
jgi:hypothetical protein